MNGILILASASERRQELLSRTGIPYEVIEADIDEIWPRGLPVNEAVITLARRKAEKVVRRFPDRWVLAADTVVTVGRDILQKPTDHRDATRMLRHLSGHAHEVWTGYCLLNQSRERILTGAARTVVIMKVLSDAEIEAYVSTGEPMDKAGAYGIQGRGAMLISEIYGSYTNVVGLPLSEVVDLLIKEGVVMPLGGER